MPRRRERFERSDVPRASTRRSVIAAVVCVAVFAAIAAVVALLWNRVTLESRLGDKDLEGALASQPGQVVAEGTGYVTSGDDFEVVALLTADGLDPVGPALTSARRVSSLARPATMSCSTSAKSSRPCFMATSSSLQARG